MPNKIARLTTDLLINTTRRKLLLGSAGAVGAVSFLGGGLFSIANQAHAENLPTSPLLGFKGVKASIADDVVVAQGYKSEVLISWGDPLVDSASAFDPNGGNSAADQEKQFGDNNDGMSFFPIDDNHGVIAINNEYVNEQYLFSHGGSKATSLEDVRKSQAAHGVSIVAVKRIGESQRWQVERPSRYNRRITANSEMQVSGPAAGHPLLQTAADPSGRKVLGTINNCANGKTPWGTYLTCEENFETYFGTQHADYKTTPEQQRYGLNAREPERNWSTFDDRFDVAKNPNELNRFGWIVEIDPMNPQAMPVKHTALGRFKHENAAVTVAKNGRLVVYMGDDERGEHIYKYVSKNKVDPINPANNHNLLDEGTLYVAQFNADVNGVPLRGTGRWIALEFGKNGLTPENGFRDPAEVLIFARKAASQVGATKMDRPEWIAVNPHDGRPYCTLTNNNKRGEAGMPMNAANPRPNNIYGQIIRWDEGGDATAEQFTWDIYLLAGNPIAYPEGINRGTPNITVDNTFNSPDGLAFDAAGRLWILTDGKYSNEGDYQGQGNNQMLVGDPNSGEIRRFMVGPKSCELTGITFTPDYKTMFVNVQHPGEEGDSHFPSNSPRPRSSVIMITREDGGIIGG
ncbi:PhoX family protein [Aeromonas cavernicola]|uniref:Transcriptional initiation protein Tat n=1 Tax=Aeromonas cavernicola TaxID=1006623 RepID=A0A2H9U2U7_9GAMM|nr:PhoX family phosphatase [Aeromonas cavernicola]PJG58330.1 transcriptional initiation protein Tat [Aeromonas cavernicola]